MNRTGAPFISFLIEKGVICQDDLEKIFSSNGTHKDISIEELLLTSGLVTESKFQSCLKEFYGVPLATQDDFPKEPVLINQLSVQFLKESKFIPARVFNNELTVIMNIPFDFYTIDAIRLATGYGIRILYGKEENISWAIEQHYGSGVTSMEKIIEDMEGIPEYRIDDEENIDHLRDMASEGPVIRLVNLIITRGIELRASDIHFEPFEEQFRVRYRIDGVLHDVESPPKRLQAAIASRNKIMSKMNIAERRLPQDGRIMLRVKGKEIDFRVSSIPTIYGESIVLRILDKGSIVLDIEKLGFPEDTLVGFNHLIQSPHGIILVTGPTGSGKTTTLYCAREKINSPDKKIITVEDPVEYQLRGINQIQVKPSIGLTFANSLRSIVRQDPDVILIGEIRDGETAEIAIHSALTGHLVLSTLHTNTAAGAIPRFLDMGAEDFLLASTINVIMAQRLVRKICTSCITKYTPNDAILKKLSKDLGVSLEDQKFYKGEGCGQCNNKGYMGRVGIYEVLEVTSKIKGLIAEKATSDEIQEMAVDEKMVTMLQDGLDKVSSGLTTIEEVIRVVREN